MSLNEVLARRVATRETIVDSEGCRVWVVRSWIPPEVAAQILELSLQFPWETRDITIYGRTVTQNRGILLVGDYTTSSTSITSTSGSSLSTSSTSSTSSTTSSSSTSSTLTPVVAGYKYSGQMVPMHPWVGQYDYARYLCQMINALLGTNFNSCLMNHYPDGASSVGLHADDERQLGRNGAVVTVSFGASRDFQLKRNSDGRLINTELHAGDLVMMEGRTQELWKHAIPKRAKVTEPRISYTFRCLSN